VNAKSPQAQAAVRFLNWLTDQPQQQFLVTNTKNLPSIKGVGENIPKVLADFSKGMDFAVHPSRFPITESPAVIERFDKAIQSILIGEKTPQAAAQDVESAKKQELSKKSS